MGDRIALTLRRDEDLKLFAEARELAAKGRSETPEELGHIETVRWGLDVAVNGTPPVNKFFASPRGLELRGAIAADLDTEAEDISALAAVRDAAAYRIGAMSSIDFVATDATELDGYEQAAELVDAPADDPAAVLEAVFNNYGEIVRKLPAAEGCGHLEEYRVDGGCLRCFNEKTTAEEREVARELVDG